ncbi:MarR family winged helix-turn-helix transcriptional regulator [Pseudonocardia alaniniphila]|uniref:MarR family winged helix-turn-helix transcriptional regulator n=1 Tax=Pseudonocardia alaniniphila TaxID=75291 RepID=A0ABS9TNH1_9PSEU|nr:MarR family winged helix-turn-helix transcriptional regulator [Pseudonocardia alaniniphila]MCH6169963.1 MarR family winged helix-turn-helix transcriptional regulator [Pseudonocardia alaniniphila]
MTSAEGGPALFRLVRFWSRRWVRGVAAGAGDTAQHVLTVEAVIACARGAGNPDGATVGDVARRLGLDQSGASRMVAAAAAAGYVERSRAAADGRRSVLRLTPAGRALIYSSHRWQRATFAELTATWDERDRAQFAGYLQRLASEVEA